MDQCGNLEWPMRDIIESHASRPPVAAGLYLNGVQRAYRHNVLALHGDNITVGMHAKLPRSGDIKLLRGGAIG